MTEEELLDLKDECAERFRDWLNKKGEYTTEVAISFAKFRKKAEAYKEMRFKMKELEK